MQPTFTQVPPKRPGSAIATRAPSRADTRLARTPPEPPPTVKRSKSKSRLLEIGEIDLHQLKLRRERLVLRLVGEPFQGVLDAGLHLRARHALDAGEHGSEI